jgi:hypothetical protein
MKCEQAQQNIALAVYGDLPDDASHQLEQHLNECEACRHDLETMQALHRAMSLYPMEEPGANLLANARMKLEEALDAVPAAGWMQRVAQSFFNSASRMAAVPVMATALLVLGLGAGGYAGYHAGQRRPLEAPTIQSDAAGDGTEQIANVSEIIQQPNSENVEVRYNRLEPVTVRGTLDDPRIRQLLVLGAQSRVSNVAHDDSVKLLALECRAGHQCDEGPVRDALLVDLRYDKSAKVRMKALEGLEPLIGQDVRVRDAVLSALMSDPDESIRSQAISMLAPVESDSSVRNVLHTVAAEDNNPHIRNVSQQVLDGLPQIQ